MTRLREFSNLADPFVAQKLEEISNRTFLESKLAKNEEWEEIAHELDRRLFSSRPLLPWIRVKWLYLTKLPKNIELTAWAMAVFASREDWEANKSYLTQYTTIQDKVIDYLEGEKTEERYVYTGVACKKLKKWIKLTETQFDRIIEEIDAIGELNNYMDTIYQKRKAVKSDKDKNSEMERQIEKPYLALGDGYVITLAQKQFGRTYEEIVNTPYNMFYIQYVWRAEEVSNSF